MEENSILDRSVEVTIVKNIDELLAVLPEQSHYDETDEELFVCNIQFRMCVRHETLIKIVESLQKKVVRLRFEDCEFTDNLFIGSSVKDEILDIEDLRFAESIFYEDIVFLGNELNPKAIGFFEVTMENSIDATETSVERVKDLAESVNSAPTEEISFWITEMISFATPDDGNYHYMEDEFEEALDTE